MPRPLYPNELFYQHDLPVQLRHRKSAGGVSALWLEMQKSVAGPGALPRDLPPFVLKIVETLWAAEPADVIHAIQTGDCAFFVAVQVRLGQIDCAMAEAGHSVAERSAIIRAKYLVEGFCEAAAVKLRELGGSWPPGT